MKHNWFDYGFFPDYLRNLGLSASTVYNYSGATYQFLKLSPDINQIEDYNEFLIKVMARSNKRGNFYYYALKHFIEYKLEDKQLRERLIKQLIKPENRDPKTPRIYLSKEKRVEVINLLQLEKHKIIALIQMMTGLRVGDILRLKKGSIQYEDYQNKRVLRIDVISKRQRKTSSYVINEASIEMISEYLGLNEEVEVNKDEYYFLNNERLLKRNCNEYLMIKSGYIKYWVDLKMALNSAKIDLNKFSTHDWRRCFSRDVFEEYKDITVLQGVLGHRDISTTARYLKHSGLNNIDVLNKLQN